MVGIAAEGSDTLQDVPGAAFYEPIDDPVAGGRQSQGRYRATAQTAGPWDAALQHAGPPTALLARAVERLETGPPRPLVARLAADIMAPLPVDEVVVRARVVRPGRRVAWCTAELSAAASPDVPLVRAHAWVLRREAAALELPETPVEAAPAPGVPTSRPPGWNPGYLDAVAWRLVEGAFDRPGAATVWTRLLVDLLPGEQPSGVQRVAAVADSGSGISAVATPAAMFFLNTDVTIHLVREPVGADIWMSARTTLDPAGVGLARTRLGDAEGALGSAAQTLFVAPR
jgi:hypothetical protein